MCYRRSFDELIILRLIPCSAFVKSVLHVTSNKQRMHLNYDGHLYQQFETAFFTPTFNQNGKSYAVQKTYFVV